MSQADSSISQNSGQSNIHVNRRAEAANAALYAALFLTAIKLGVGFLSHSVGVISEGIHSGLDLVSAAVAYFTIREAVKPADLDHPFGHGKFETLSSLIESLLLFVAAGIIVYEGVDHLRNPVEVTHTGAAIAVIAVSLVISWIVYRHNEKAGRETESSAIQVNALHFLADAVTSAGVLFALVAIHFTGVTWIDPIVAFGIAFYIIAISWRQVARSIHELTDSTLPSDEVEEVENLLNSFKPRILEIHDLRTRKSGVHRHFDFHLLVCGRLTVKESHAVCDEIEAALEAKYPFSQVSIHVEPCGHEGSRPPRACTRFPTEKCLASSV